MADLALYIWLFDKLLRWIPKSFLLLPCLCMNPVNVRLERVPTRSHETAYVTLPSLLTLFRMPVPHVHFQLKYVNIFFADLTLYFRRVHIQFMSFKS